MFSDSLSLQIFIKNDFVYRVARWHGTYGRSDYDQIVYKPTCEKVLQRKRRGMCFLLICFLENYSKVWVWLIKMLKYKWFFWERERLKTLNLAPSKQMHTADFWNRIFFCPYSVSKRCGYANQLPETERRGFVNSPTETAPHPWKRSVKWFRALSTRIRGTIYAVSKMSGLVWTRPKCRDAGHVVLFAF